MVQALANWDLSLYRFINLRLTAGWLDPIVLLLSSELFWAMVLFAFVLIAVLRRDTAAMKMLTVVVIAIGVSDVLSSQVLKPKLGRIRPCHGLEVRRVNNICGSGFGMPSNHASNGMAVATLIGLFAPRPWFLVSLVFVVLTGFTRVYLGVHYPGDVLVGYAFGALWGLILGGLFGPLLRKSLPR